MKIHIFNPEHDIALATHVKRFTAPHAARQLRTEMGFLPALWAKDGDVVLVDDVRIATRRLCHLRQYVSNVRLVSLNDKHAMRHLQQYVDEIDSIEPWGWDPVVAEVLAKAGLPASLIPSEQQLLDLRDISSRQWASTHLLPVVVGIDDRLVGASSYVANTEELSRVLSDGGKYVLKAPWSSSGRGIRYISTADHWLRNQTWAHNVIERQGGIMVEPYYNKVKDLGMEFSVHSNGSVVYDGLSMFQTINGAYSGSIIDTEWSKCAMIERYIPMGLLEKVKDKICAVFQPLLAGRYQGPLGVDMMIVTSEKGEFLLHPCVELNLRRTMGHVALSFDVSDAMPRRLMRIYYTGKYHFRVSRVKKT